MNQITFICDFQDLQKEVHAIATDRGWIVNTTPESLGLQIALMHSELSEALEYSRFPDDSERITSNHIPNFLGIEEEFADTIIRIMHISEVFKLRTAEAILAKIEFNRSREYKHGNKKF